MSPVQDQRKMIPINCPTPKVHPQWPSKTHVKLMGQVDAYVLSGPIGRAFDELDEDEGRPRGPVDLVRPLILN